MAYAKFDPDKADFLAAAIQNHGNIKALSRHYKIAAETIYQYMYRDPVGKEIIDIVRGLNTETDLDLAEHVIRYNLANFKENAAIAQRAAEFMIDRKGKSRGWEITEDTVPPFQSNIDMADQFIQMKAEHALKDQRIAELEAQVASKQ